MSLSPFLIPPNSPRARERKPLFLGQFNRMAARFLAETELGGVGDKFGGNVSVDFANLH